MISSSITTTKNIVMSIIHLQKKMKKKNWNLFGSESVIPEADPNPHQYEADPKHHHYYTLFRHVLNTDPRRCWVCRLTPTFPTWPGSTARGSREGWAD